MLTKRIIPCLDIKNGRTVKGINFVDLKDAGDPVILAEQYAKLGADELVFLDISATIEGRKTTQDMVLRIAENINIPFTVGGGISSIKDVDALLSSGADKVAINSSAIRRPGIISELAKRFGSQCIVVAIDAQYLWNGWCVYSSGGTVATPLKLFDWAKEVENLGAGELLFTSMNHDGTKSGFAIEALARLNDCVNIPIIASGGAGSISHFNDVFTYGKADAALAASVFHFGEIDIMNLKHELKQQKINIRL